MTADSQYTSVTDENGFFVLDSLPPGEYDLEVRPIHYSRRRLPTITVMPVEIQVMDNIFLSTHPYPIFATFPADGDDSVRASYAGVRILTDEPLDLEDLRAHTTISPLLAGVWSELYNSGAPQRTYAFTPTVELFPVSTDFHIEIDGTVRTAAGVPLGSDVTITFTTEPLVLLWGQFSNRGSGWPMLLSDFRPILSFNAPVNRDSLNRAARFEPHIEGIWLSDLEEPSRFRFLPLSSSPVKGSTSYHFVVSDEIPLLEQMRLAVPFTFDFVTVPYGVTSVSPCSGCATSGWGGFPRLQFNVGMDTVSVAGAFTLTYGGDTLVPGWLNWYSDDLREVQFVPEDDLPLNRIYRIHLSHSARTVEGDSLVAEFESFYSVIEY